MGANLMAEGGLGVGFKPSGAAGGVAGIVVVANPAALAAYDATGLPSGALASVGVVNDSYRFLLAPSAALLAMADGVNVVLATAPAGALWVRLYERNEAAWAEVAWFVDQTAGSDANDGVTLGTALKTLSELAIRLRGSTGTTTATLVGNHTYGPAAFELNTPAGGLVLLQGQTALSGGGLVSAAVTAVPATNTQESVTDAAAGVFAYRQRLRLTSGANAGAYSTVLRPTAGTAITAVVQRWQVFTAYATGTIPTLVTPAIGDAYQVETLLATVSGVQMRQSGAGRFGILECNVTGANRFEGNIFGCGACFRCDIAGAWSSSSVVTVSCRTLAGATMADTRWLARGHCFGAQLIVQQNSYMNASNGTTFENGGVSVQRGSVWDNSGTDINFINQAAQAMTVAGGGYIAMAGATVWGTLGNTVAFFRTFTGGWIVYQAPASITATTTAASNALVSAVGNLNVLPFIDANRGTGITNAP